MFEQISDELDISSEMLRKKSATILKTILHNYGAFDVSTIDRFNHRLIRTFAYDLKLPLNFEVELDTEYQLSKAVDRLIDKAGSDQQLTDLLVDFAIEKADDDRSWDISHDFNSIAKLLTLENHLDHIDRLKDKTIADFKKLQNSLFKRLKHGELTIKKLAEDALNLIAQNGLEHDDFSRSTLPNHFKKAGQLQLTGLYNNKLQENLANKSGIYTTKLQADKANLIDTLLPTIENIYLELKSHVHNYTFVKNALKNVIPLSVLTEIHKSLNELKAEEDFILISEFNAIINAEIKQQPAPFIYERIGEKYRNYFIDEFQDTSTLQWENMLPLVDNAISSQNLKGEVGSALLVGDAKQSIYRWRGGKAEQFINLYQGNELPLSMKQEVHNLPKNFRSAKTIVNFNNSFFKHLSGKMFRMEEHRATYAVDEQKINSTLNGYVDLSFLDSSTEIDLHMAYAEQVLETLKKVLNQGFSKRDICIVVRKSKEGVALADYLIENDVSIVSSETLLLKNSTEVLFVNNLMKLSIDPENLVVRMSVLDFMASDLLDISDKHAFFAQHLRMELADMFEQLKEHGFDFNFDHYLSLPMYEATEMAIRTFGLNHASNAYLQFYLDEVLAFSERNQSSFSAFQEYWERKKDKLSIVSAEGQDAVEIMTIHKSKGLEFPVVVFPYANQSIYFDKQPKVWFPVDPKEYDGFSELYLNLNKDLADYNTTGEALYELHQAELELDSINLLYVALTRAAEQLYIISDRDFSKKPSTEPKKYSDLFVDFLGSEGKWQDQQTHYQFGDISREKTQHVAENSAEELHLISTSKESHQLHIVTRNGLLWDTHQEAAIERGNLLHDIMAEIKNSSDAESVLQKFQHHGTINREQLELLEYDIQHIFNHPKLVGLYHPEKIVLNEKAIISKDGSVLRPDRIVFMSENNVILMDYKTGKSKPVHEEQLYLYQEQLEAMGFKVMRKILIYIDSQITVKEF